MDDYEYRRNPGSVFGPHGNAAWQSYKQSKFEHMLVTHIMLRFRLARLRNYLLKITGTLNLPLFIEAVGDLPFDLCCSTLGQPIEKPLHYRQEAVFPNWLNRPRRLPFLIPYEEFVECYPHGKGTNVGLVFPRQGFRYGLVVHDGDPERWVPPGEGYVGMAPKKQQRRLVVQSFRGLLDQVAKVWKPRRDLFILNPDPSDAEE